MVIFHCYVSSPEGNHPLIHHKPSIESPLRPATSPAPPSTAPPFPPRPALLPRPRQRWARGGGGPGTTAGGDWRTNGRAGTNSLRVSGFGWGPTATFELMKV